MAPKTTSKAKTSDVSESAPVVSAPAVSVSAPVVSAAEKVKAVKPAKASKVETVVSVEVSTAPVEVKTESKAKSTKTAKATKVESLAETKVESVEQSSAVVSDDAAAVAELEASIAAQSLEFMSKLTQLSTMVASLKTEYRNLEKKWSRELKAAQKSGSKKRRRTGNRAPSGFVKPTRISDELASFLGKDKGTEMARTDVTREINLYIRSHDLQDKTNGRKINPDTKLQSLLKLKKTDELTYFNLQRYMSPHFQKSAEAAAAAAAASSVSA